MNKTNKIAKFLDSINNLKRAGEENSPAVLKLKTACKELSQLIIDFIPRDETPDLPEGYSITTLENRRVLLKEGLPLDNPDRRLTLSFAEDIARGILEKGFNMEIEFHKHIRRLKIMGQEDSKKMTALKTASRDLAAFIIDTLPETETELPMGYSLRIVSGKINLFKGDMSLENPDRAMALTFAEDVAAGLIEKVEKNFNIEIRVKD